MKLLIPSAKIMPEELQNLGKLPAIIYPVGQGISFDYLWNQYNSLVDEVKILYFEMAEEVERGLSSYRSEKIRLIRLAQLGDLGNTIYEGLEETHTPVIINFADTIVLEHLPDNGEDSFFYSEEYPSETWTFFENEEGIFISICDKKEGLDTEKRQKLFVGVFQFSDEADLKACLREAFETPERTMSTFYTALMRYSQLHPMRELYAENWFDIGHADRYYESKLEVKAREFNHITIDKDRGILRKTSEDKEKFIGEILWYLKLPADIEYVRPRIFSYSTSYREPYVSMEYYSYHTVHELFLYGDLNYHQWIDIFNRIRFIYNDFQRYSVKDAGIQDALKDIYLDKTLKRLGKLRQDDRFAAFFEKPMRINQVEYLPLNEICRVLEREIPGRLYDVDTFHIIHGDLCFANIMVDSNFSFIKVIDPRGKFGPYDIYGDQRYELAKLFHSVDGKYDYIIKDLFRIDVDAGNARIDYEILERKRDFDLYEVFLKVFREEIKDAKQKVELIEALLFLSMIPLHGESLEHQYAMLATGIRLLDRMLKIRTEEKEYRE